MALKISEKCALLALEGNDTGVPHLTFFKLSDMTIAKTDYVAEMLMKRMDLLDTTADSEQIGIWKITELFKNAANETIAVRISYSQDKPAWIADNLLNGLLS